MRIDGIEFGCVQGKLRPIFPEHEAEVWRSFVDYTYSFPVRANDVVYIGARDHHVHAIDAASKKKVWSYKTRGFVDAAPAISDGLLYVTSHDGYLYAFENRTEESLQPQPDDRNIGIVVHDEAPVYSAKDSDSPVQLHLNDGVVLPILNEGGGWYEVELPGSETGWMDEFGIGRFEETNDVQFNASICSNIRTLELTEGGEYPHWSPDGKAIAFFNRKDLSGQYWKASEIWITDKEANRFRRLCEGKFYNPNLSWSFNGNLLAFEARKEGESEVWTFDLKTARLTNLVNGEAPVWSPVANKIAFRRWEKGFDVVYQINSDTSGLAPIARIPIEGRVGAFSFLDIPRGRRMGSGSLSGWITSTTSRVTPAFDCRTSTERGLAKYVRSTSASSRFTGPRTPKTLPMCCKEAFALTACWTNVFTSLMSMNEAGQGFSNTHRPHGRPKGNTWRIWSMKIVWACDGRCGYLMWKRIKNAPLRVRRELSPP